MKMSVKTAGDVTIEVEAFNEKQHGTNEIVVSAFDESGNFLQDLCLVRHNLFNEFEVLVWADCSNENYTNSFRTKNMEV